jgi:hypothetical protein
VPLAVEDDVDRRNVRHLKLQISISVIAVDKSGDILKHHTGKTCALTGRTEYC